MDHFYVTGVLRNTSHCRRRVSFCSGEWETIANIIFAFPFAPNAKDKNKLLHFHDFPNEEKKIETVVR